MKKIFFFLAVAVAAIACQPKEETVTPEVKVVTEGALVIEQAGGEALIDFDANVDWTAEFKDAAAAEWCSLSPKSGVAGPSKVKVTAIENDGNENREVVVVIKAQTASAEVTVSQLQKDALVAGAAKVEVPAEGGEVKFTLATNVEYEVKIDGEWLTEVKSKAYEEKTLVFNAEANESLEVRTAKITITAGALKQEITVEQAAFVPTFEMDATELWLAVEGGTAELNITANFEYSVEVESGCDWLTVTNEGGKYTFTATANPDFYYRAAHVIINGWTIWDDETTKDVDESRKFYVFQNGRAEVKWQKSMVADYSMNLVAGPARMAVSGDYVLISNNSSAITVLDKATGSVLNTIELPNGLVAKSLTNDDAGNLIVATEAVYQGDPAQLYYVPAENISGEPQLLGTIANNDIWTNGLTGNLRVRGDVTNDATVIMFVPASNYWLGFEVKDGVAGPNVFGGVGNDLNGVGYGYGCVAPLGSTIADGIVFSGYTAPHNIFYKSTDADGKVFASVVEGSWNSNDNPCSIHSAEIGGKKYVAFGIGTFFYYTQARVVLYELVGQTATHVGTWNLPESSSSWVSLVGPYADVVLAEGADGSIVVYYLSGNNQMVDCIVIK